jgi:hypothetical protein
MSYLAYQFTLYVNHLFEIFSTDELVSQRVSSPISPLTEGTIIGGPEEDRVLALNTSSQSRYRGALIDFLPLL